MSFPSVLSSFPRPNPTDRLNSPSHSALHNTVSSALGQIEAVIGVEGSNSVVGTLEYLIKSPASDGGGHVQVANKGGTGQTSYNKGDVLVAQSSSVLTKLSVGADGTFLGADSTQATGITWGTVAKLDYQAFSVTGTWTKPAGVSSNALVVIQLWGGGGSGAAGNSAGAGGGGGGAFREIRVLASTLGATVPVTIGLGGASVAAGSNDGNNGNTTSFGNYNVYGGAKGLSNNNGRTGGGGGGMTSAGTGQTGGGLVGSAANTDNGGFGGAGGGNAGTAGGNATMGGGGGGGGNTSGSASGNGGNSEHGGAGGGGVNNLSNATTGGVSNLGGNGGGGSTIGIAGTPPGGGGGAGNSGVSGQGARGEARVWIV